MRVAIFHDYLNQFGGAERVLQALLEIFPNANLYTLLYDEKKTFGFFKNKVKKTSILDYQWLRNHHRLFIPLMPLAASTITVDNNYDLIISSTAGYAKGFGYHRHNNHNNHNHRPYHISYCHSPLRYAWEIDYLKNLPFAPQLLKEFVAKPIADWLRRWDKQAANQVNLFVTNSEFTAKKIMSYYNREAIVVYPPVDTDIFYRQQPKPKISNYFLMVGRLLYYKRFDLGIEAFNQLKLPLKIVGLGPEFKKLKKLVRNPEIEFIGLVKDEELRSFYNEARGLIFPQVEDFGLVAAETQACGLPVIAYGVGGALEIVENKKTGIFFYSQTPEAIIAAIREFESLSFNRDYIAERAATLFSKKNFKKKISEIINCSGFSNFI